jgi:hypothetical protein
VDTSRKTIDFTTQATKVTADVLKSIFRDFLSGKSKKSGRKMYGELAKTGKLENIEVTENNIKDFLKTAQKYDIDYALKKDTSTSPATYHIFFETSNSENFQRAAYGINKKLEKKSVSDVVNREQIKQNAKTIAKQQSDLSKEKSLNKSDMGR